MKCFLIVFKHADKERINKKTRKLARAARIVLAGVWSSCRILMRYETEWRERATESARCTLLARIIKNSNNSFCLYFWNRFDGVWTRREHTKKIMMRLARSEAMLRKKINLSHLICIYSRFRTSLCRHKPFTTKTSPSKASTNHLQISTQPHLTKNFIFITKLLLEVALSV